MLRSISILILLLIIKLVLHVYLPKGFLAYLFPTLCWLIMIIVVLALWSINEVFSIVDRNLLIIALLFALFQIVLLIDGGLFTKFGKSPVSFSFPTLLLNTLMIATSLIGVEFSRAYLLRTCRKKGPLIIPLISFLYSPFLTLISMFIHGTVPLALVKFLGSVFLPELSKNLLASYIALLAGPLASLAYVTPLKIFKWYSPILPDLPWPLESFIGVLTPTIGFMLVDRIAPTRLLRGIYMKFNKNLKKKEGGNLKWIMVMSLITLIWVWFNSGFFGVFPSVAVSGSMSPTIEVGDLVILVKTSNIKLGDIIQYRTKDSMVLHRVIAFEGSYLITKGDSCRAPDPDPVLPFQVMGKVIIIIPKVGWATIIVRSVISRIISIIWTNFIHETMAFYIALVSMTSIFLFYLYKRKLHSRRRMRVI